MGHSRERDYIATRCLAGSCYLVVHTLPCCPGVAAVAGASGPSQVERPTLRRLKGGHDNVTACWQSWLAAMRTPCRNPGAIWRVGAWEAWSAARRHWTFTVTADGSYFGHSQGSVWPIRSRIGPTQHTPNSARLES